jgi:hypothetical protein
MSFESDITANIKHIQHKIDVREQLIGHLTGENCECDCDKCMSAHADAYDQDEVDELRRELDTWRRELKLLKTSPVTVI